MKRETLSDALGLIDEELLLETLALRARRGRRPLLRLAAAAAAIALTALAGAALLARRAAPSLPLLEISEEAAGGMGFEGYMAYDISELTSANPWNEGMKLKKLPVYRNRAQLDEAGRPAGPDLEKMKALLIETARRLGLDAENLPITDDVPDEQTRRQITEKMQVAGVEVPEGYFDPQELCMQGEGIDIRVDGSLTATISFDPPVSLPESCNFAPGAGYGELEAVAGYLQEEYAALLAGMKKPALNLHGGDYSYDGVSAQQSYGIEFFDGGGSAVSRIVSFNLNRIAFYGNDEGELFLARVFAPDLSEKLGDYPIISRQEAERLLLEGHFITSVPYEAPAAESVCKAELIYRASGREACLMPYYRFYAELPEAQQENGLKTYGAYYVPAIERDWLTGLPTWDGSFN